MLTYETYKVLHLLGIFLLFVALAGVSLHAANGLARADNRLRRVVSIMHGVGLLLILVGGFGMLARLGAAASASGEGWVIGKLVIWFIAGGLLVLPYKKPARAPLIFVLLPLLGVAAAILAIYKPF